MEDNAFMDIIHQDDVFEEMSLDMLQGLSWNDQDCECQCRGNCNKVVIICPMYIEGCPQNHM